VLIPNYGPHRLLPYGSGEKFLLSSQDDETRPFGITCFLEDARARTKHIYVTLGEEAGCHTTSGDETIDFFFSKNVEGQVISVMAGCYKAGAEEAFKFVYPHVLQMLSNLAFRFRRPIGVYEVRVHDKKNSATWGIPAIAPSNLPEIKFPLVTLSETPLNSLVAVFREGMNSVSPAGRFLNYYKILEAYPNSGPFQLSLKSLKERGRTRNILTVTHEMMTGAYVDKYHADFIGKRIHWCRDQLRKWRDVLAHPFLQGDTYIDLDCVEHQATLAAYADLVERLAALVLEDEFRLWAELSGRPDLVQASASYVGA